MPDKSLDRSKKTATTIAELLAKEGLSSVIPFGGLLYDASKALILHTRNYISDRTNDRMEDFCEHLISGRASDEELKVFLEKKFDMDDYYAVLSSCMQDIENEKVLIYSELMKGLIEGDFSPEIRRYFIKSCKELTFAELSFLREIYINSEYVMMPHSGCVTGTAHQVKQILTTNDPFRRITIERLISLGFVNNQLNEMTPLGKKFGLVLFPSESLTPESINRKRFSGHHVLIASYQLSDQNHVSLAMQLQDRFIQKNIQPQIAVLKYGVFPFSAAVVLMDGKLIEREYLESLRRCSNLIPIVRLNLNSTASNYLEGVRFLSELCLEEDPDEAINKTVEIISGLLITTKCDN
ncbi:MULTISPECIES: hypothetical protein [Methylomonas]|uniref:Uncharacterized protein n=1 Tax=Methylomonas koyamae TaxID=702114 RepID=A0A177NQ59_9GAMM|nr:hypothetical protein [Methylomonas koyamae]OAI19674.1 hypothetical protein A1355_04010 [Methylomonas koyamae]